MGSESIFTKMRHVVLLGLFCVTASGGAEAGRQQATVYYEQAAVLFNAGKYPEAIIQLKNALKDDGALLAARILLGQAYMESGDAAAAEKELHEAERLGADKGLTAVPLAKSYLKQYKYQALLNDLYLDAYPASVQGELLAYHGHAYLEMQQLKEAEKAFRQASERAPLSPAPLSGLALMQLRAGNTAEAEGAVKKALALAPADVDALSVKAAMIHARGDLKAAIAAYGVVVAKEPTHLEARLARAGVYIDLKEYTKAATDLGYLTTKYPFEPRVIYMHSLVYGYLNEPAKAQQALKKAAAIIDGLPTAMLLQSRQLMLLAGLTYSGIGNYQQAQSHLERLLKLDSKNIAARKLLGAVLLALKKYDDVVAQLQPLVDSGVRDYKLLTLLGTAYMHKGQHDKAVALLEDAVALGGGDLDPRFHLALSNFGAGKQAQGSAELAAIFEKNSNRSDVGAALAVMYIKQGKSDAAINALKTILLQEPGNITFNNLLGTAQVLAGQYDAARVTFTKVETQVPKFIPVQINLSRLDSLTGRHDKASQRLQAAMIIEGAPVALLMFEQAKVAEVAGDRDGAIRWAEKGRSQDRNALPLRRYLVGLYQRSDDPKKALDVALEAKLIAPEDLEVLDLVANGYITANDPRGAAGLLRQMTTLAGFDHQWLYRIAEKQYLIKSYKEAEWSLQKAVQAAPGFAPANVALIETLIGLDKVDEAEVKLRAAQKNISGFAEGERLLGDLYLKRGDQQRAIASYEIAQRRQPTATLAIKLYQAYAAAGDWSKAVAVMRDWSSRHPQDLNAKQALAEAYLRQGQYQQAAAVYEEVAKNSPDNGPLLSNLAFTYLKMGKLNRALDLAQKAYGLSPNDAGVSDTLGWVLVKSGQAEKGLSYLRDAFSRASNNPEIRYHIAATLAELGRTAEAKTELSAVLDSKLEFDGIGEARALQRRLVK
ncbi:MAG: XrtA/PEP-CTERM system TPR-repeat protein PrsT [Pseudomonadota bacterium]|nr:XrtA/PEP-CTERM system TPR-repeat protein PrsT [Pseudomonadota bacterium]